MMLLFIVEANRLRLNYKSLSLEIFDLLLKLIYDREFIYSITYFILYF